MSLSALTDRVNSHYTASHSSRCHPESAHQPPYTQRQCRTFNCPQRADHSSRLKAFGVCMCSSQRDEPFPGTALASEFSQHINQTGTRRPLEHRGPTPMLPPTTVVAAQMDALQMNDWPDTDSGVRTAFLFSKPFECETMIAGRANPTECHSWQGREQWVAYREFADALHTHPLDVLLNCESWQPRSQMLFPSKRKENRAVQVVEVQAPSRGGEPPRRPYTFTFCLERVDVGPYKGCWMTVGLRLGDYSV